MFDVKAPAKFASVHEWRTNVCQQHPQSASNRSPSISLLQPAYKAETVRAPSVWYGLNNVDPAGFISKYKQEVLVFLLCSEEEMGLAKGHRTQNKSHKISCVEDFTKEGGAVCNLSTDDFIWIVMLTEGFWSH